MPNPATKRTNVSSSVKSNPREDKPWLHEQVPMVFVTEAGFVCEIRRGTFGALNGYIHIPKGHRDYGSTYHEINTEYWTDGLEVHDDKIPPYPAVHGGWTHSDTNEHTTVFGFDCAHAGDFVPNAANSLYEVYRDVNFVVEQLEAAAVVFKERAAYARVDK